MAIPDPTIRRRLRPPSLTRIRTDEPALPERPGTAVADRRLPADHPPSLHPTQAHKPDIPVSRTRSSDQRDDGAERRIVPAPAPGQPLASSVVAALGPCALSHVLARGSPTFVVRLRFIGLPHGCRAPGYMALFLWAPGPPASRGPNFFPRPCGAPRARFAAKKPAPSAP